MNPLCAKRLDEMIGSISSGAMTGNEEVRFAISDEASGLFKAVFGRLKKMESADDPVDSFDSRYFANVVNGIDDTGMATPRQNDQPAACFEP